MSDHTLHGSKGRFLSLHGDPCADELIGLYTTKLSQILTIRFLRQDVRYT